MQPMTHATSTRWPATALFGRDDELGLLRDHLRAAQAGQSSMVLVIDEAGIGKSTLRRRDLAHVKLAMEMYVSTSAGC